MSKMKLAIVGAMDSEILYLKERMIEFGKIEEVEIHGFVFYLGSLFDKDIILVKSGVGRVASAILLTILCDHFKGIDKIINVGVAGGYGKLSVGDIVVGEIGSLSSQRTSPVFFITQRSSPGRSLKP